MSDNKPLLAMTMGDPAGVGAEIIVKAYAMADLHSKASTFVIGSASCLRLAMTQTGIDLPLLVIHEPAEAKPGVLSVLDPHSLNAGDFIQGEVSADCGHAAVGYFEAAIRLCQADQADGIVTCPINKEAVHVAGYVGDIGHQEILARMTGASSTATMLITPGLKVAHLSTHKPLAEAVAFVKAPVIIEKLRLTVRSLEAWGVHEPVVGVAALNPHGGEGGMLGREELDEIIPAVKACQAEGMQVSGPYPADSIFYRAVEGEFDVVLALYHDQGHIAIKVHNFEKSVTVTMGIPFVRTSVDHGTAFDIAGRNMADARGLLNATTTAVSMLNQELS
ncbi:MAG: 4-hydroxythreonine-4-phosphate dehydrogenase PdxA [Gammaproteobacteria bacterium]|nr:4-hydroxythreonine-4-phosphate dehydrogenase PdxA [Gammaproteobacteria bacterium]MBT4491642.1 4-hydroxythreonine-4-phosphate dehydrogenase PdxA [Gammaproteobacteria bacterium]MBT7371400.1 4-hydroxythreonine-4-phosphate dehydrogenase PdxA [Gammaproteobacteria bacterium]